MIEYTIRDTETGQVCEGKAMAVMLLATEIKGEEAKRAGANCVGAFFGEGRGVMKMIEIIKRSSLETEGSPFRHLIADILQLEKDRDYLAKLMPLLLKDAVEAMTELSAASPDVKREFDAFMRDYAMGGGGE